MVRTLLVHVVEVEIAHQARVALLNGRAHRLGEHLVPVSEARAVQPIGQVPTTKRLLPVFILSGNIGAHLLGRHIAVFLNIVPRLVHELYFLKLRHQVRIQCPRRGDMPPLQVVVAVAHTLGQLAVKVGIAQLQHVPVPLGKCLPLLFAVAQGLTLGRQCLERLPHVLEVVGARLIPLVGVGDLLEHRRILGCQTVVEQCLRPLPCHHRGQRVIQRQHRHALALPEQQRTAALQLLHARLVLQSALTPCVKLIAEALRAVVAAQREAVSRHRGLEIRLQLHVAAIEGGGSRILQQPLKLIGKAFAARSHIVVQLREPPVALCPEFITLKSLAQIAAVYRVHFADIAVAYQYFRVDDLIYRVGAQLDAVMRRDICTLQLLPLLHLLPLRLREGNIRPVAEVSVDIHDQTLGSCDFGVVVAQHLRRQTGVGHLGQMLRDLQRLPHGSHHNIGALPGKLRLYQLADFRVSHIGQLRVAVPPLGDGLRKVCVPVIGVRVEQERDLLVPQIDELLRRRQIVLRRLGILAEKPLALYIVMEQTAHTAGIVTPVRLQLPPILLRQIGIVARIHPSLVQVVGVFVGDMQVLLYRRIQLLPQLSGELTPLTAFLACIARHPAGRHTRTAVLWVVQHLEYLLLGVDRSHCLVDIAFRLGACLLIGHLRICRLYALYQSGHFL